MEQTNKISAKLFDIFDSIKVVSDLRVILFDTEGTTIGKLRKALELVSSIELDNIAKEIWDEVADNISYEQIVEILNEKFREVLTWKPNQTTILSMKTDLEEDLKGYFEKMELLGVIISDDSKVKITSLYIQIGLRLLKVNVDLDSVLSELEANLDRYEAESTELRTKAALFNIKLAPNRIQDFAKQFIRMFQQGYFIPIDESDELTEIDIIMAIEHYFAIQILGTDWFEPDEYLSFDGIVYQSTVDESNDSVTMMIEPQHTIALVNNAPKTLKPFSAYLIHPHKEQLAKAIQQEFRNERGKSMRLMLAALELHTPPLMAIASRKNKEIYEALKCFMGDDIGSYQSVFGYKVDADYDKNDIQAMTIRIQHLLDKK